MWKVRRNTALGGEKEFDCNDQEFLNLVGKRKIKSDTLVFHQKYTSGQWANAGKLKTWQNIKQRAAEIVRKAELEAASLKAEKKRAQLEARALVKQAAEEEVAQREFEQNEVVRPAPAPVPVQPQISTTQFHNATVQTSQTSVPKEMGVATQVVVTHHTNHLGIAGFVTSILGILSCGVLAPIGIVLSFFGVFYAPRGMAIAGLLLGFLGILPFVLVIVPMVIGTGAVVATAASVGEELERMEQEETNNQRESLEKLQNFRIVDASITSEVNAIGRTENKISLTIVNNLGFPVSRFYAVVIAADDGRSIPYVKDSFNYEFSGGIESGESQSLTLQPNMFSDLGDTSVPPTARTTVIVYRVDGADGEAVYDADELVFEQYKVSRF